MASLTTIAQLASVAQTAQEVAKAVNALRKSGNMEAARVLEQECNRACAAVVRTAQRRRSAASRARQARR